MKSINLTVVATILLIGQAFAYDPPEIIGVLSGAPPDSQEFAQAFCWAGDQNGDGYDDLLVIHDGFYNYPGEERRAVNAVKLYYGGEQVDNTPDMVFQFDKDVEAISGLNYLGRLTNDNDHWFAIGSRVYEDQDRIARRLYFFKGGRELDTIPDIVWTLPYDSCYTLGPGHLMRPSDFNGDGFDDLAVALIGDVEERYSRGNRIFFGGIDFDDTPEWTHLYPGPGSFVGSIGLHTGADLNNDGYSDFMNWSTLYLGGDPMDTTAIWTYINIDGDTAAGDTTNRMLHQFIMFPDVNSDGYDDWGCYWTDSGERQNQDGYYLFYGSEHPDMIPDVDLEGNHSIWDTRGVISGGDVNGDGLGDIIGINQSGYSQDGEMHISFGSRWIESDASMNICVRQEYGVNPGVRIGAVGDYNGDGTQDFVASTAPSRHGLIWGRLYLFAGSRDWEVSVPREPLESSLKEHQWWITASPNPFNSLLTITIMGDLNGEFQVSLIDIQGREIKKVIKLPASGVQYILSIVADDIPGGIYFVKCTNRISSAQTNSKILKVVLLR